MVRCCRACTPATRRQFFQLLDSYVLIPSTLYALFVALAAMRADGLLSTPRAAVYAPLLALFLGSTLLSARQMRAEEGDDRFAFGIIAFSCGALLLTTALLAAGSVSHLAALSPLIALFGVPSAACLFYLCRKACWRDTRDCGEFFRTLVASCVSCFPALAATVLVGAKLDGHLARARWRDLLAPIWVIDAALMLALAVGSGVLACTENRQWRAHNVLMAACGWCLVMPAVAAEALLARWLDLGGEAASWSRDPGVGAAWAARYPALRVALPVLVGWAALALLRAAELAARAARRCQRYTAAASARVRARRAEKRALRGRRVKSKGKAAAGVPAAAKYGYGALGEAPGGGVSKQPLLGPSAREPPPANPTAGDGGAAGAGAGAWAGGADGGATSASDADEPEAEAARAAWDALSAQSEYENLVEAVRAHVIGVQAGRRQQGDSEARLLTLLTQAHALVVAHAGALVTAANRRRLRAVPAIVRADSDASPRRRQRYSQLWSRDVAQQYGKLLREMSRVGQLRRQLQGMRALPGAAPGAGAVLLVDASPVRTAAVPAAARAAAGGRGTARLNGNNGREDVTQQLRRMGRMEELV
eukprot:g3974.t1